VLRWRVVVAECQCVMNITVGDEIEALSATVAGTQPQIVDAADEPLIVGMTWQTRGHRRTTA